MVYINFNDLNDEAKERLLRISREDVKNRFGSDIKKYVANNYGCFETMIEEEAQRNLYTFTYVFNI